MGEWMGELERNQEKLDYAKKHFKEHSEYPIRVALEEIAAISARIRKHYRGLTMDTSEGIELDYLMDEIEEIAKKALDAET